MEKVKEVQPAAATPSPLKAPSKPLPTALTTGSGHSSAAPQSATPTKQQAALLSALSTVGGVVVVSAQPSSTLPNPPPLISVSSAPATTQGHGGSSSAGIKPSASLTLVGKLGQKSEPAVVQTQGVEIRQVNPITTTSDTKNSTGGLGAGKPKAFLTLMTSTAKKQPKKTPPSANKASKAQGNKTLLSSAQPKKADPTPSRTSNRSIKRPRTYDEECDDLKAVKPVPGKKQKGTPKVSGVCLCVCVEGGRGGKSICGLLTSNCQQLATGIRVESEEVFDCVQLY
jgi:hypothetical protein